MSTRAEVADGRKVGVLTRDDIRDALREYAERYGTDFSQSAFSPGSAKRNGRPDLVERYYQGRRDGRPWPSLNGIKSKYGGSWNAARADIGLPPNTTGPARGRRKAGDADPILHVRERLVYVPHQKTVELARRASRLEERLASVLAQRDRLRDELRAARVRPVREVVRERSVRVPVVKTKTVTKTVKVKDARAVERLRSRLADEQAAHRATVDQLRAGTREWNREKARFAMLEAAVAESREALRMAEHDRDRAGDRAVALEAVLERLKAEIAEVREQAMGVTEAAAVAELVQHAEARAEQAEVRAARAEREMAEQGAAVTGEMRRLTQAELADLRRNGPDGPSVMAAAITSLAVARRRGGKDRLRLALTEVAQAAVSWRDRL